MSAERETESVLRRYAKRNVGDRYSPLNADVWQTLQERERALVALFVRLGWMDLSGRRVVEVGSGGGGNLLDLLRLGFAPANLAGVELLPERHARARRVLPEGVNLHCGDALEFVLEQCSQDAVLASTVFSSLLDNTFQQRLADTMWRWVKPGGGVLWYDFTVNNPRNPDVRGVPINRVRQLFPQGRLQYQRVTLAPPIARVVTRLHPALYTLFNAFPPLRTHVLAWIAKD